MIFECFPLDLSFEKDPSTDHLYFKNNQHSTFLVFIPNNFKKIVI